DDAGNRLQVTCDAPGGGRTTRTFSAGQVQAINVSLKGGNDSCRYDLLSDLTFAKHVTVSLGGGNDLLDVELSQSSPHALHAGCSFDVSGGAGTDRIQFDPMPGNALGIDRGSTLRIHLDGGAGRDTVAAGYQGLLAGFLDFQVTGGAGR